ncbi:MAG TPA: zf-HC2 domain-containing protein [Planctomycetota bacterium]|nr:zf-HC2 domain-containing protein [Planctomycetota bacterium]
MNCGDFDALLQRHLDGELLPAEEAPVRDHAGTCPRCARELRLAAEEWRALVGAFAPRAAAQRVAGRVRAALAPRRSVRWSRVAGFAAAGAGLAAALVLALRPDRSPALGRVVLPVASACGDPCAVPLAPGTCALPEMNCGVEVSRQAPHCTLSLTSCSTRIASPALGDFVVSGTGRAEVWLFRPGEVEPALPPQILAIRAATGAQGIVLIGDGEVRVANASGAVQSARSTGILLRPGAAPQALAASPLY